MRALDALTFNWTSALEDVWLPSDYHVEGLHAEAADLIRRGIAEAATSSRANPLGLPLVGQRGVGKTHLLGWAREQVQAAGGYFFLLGDLTRTTFWEEARTAMVQQLLPFKDGSRNQIGRLLADLADKAGVGDAVRNAVTGVVVPSPADVSEFIAALRRLDSSVGLPCQDTARALVLLASPEFGHQDIGLFYLDGGDVDDVERRHWGFRTRPRTARFVINQVSQILALSGPAVVAVDQVDALIDEVNNGVDSALAAEVATGLMDLRDTTRRAFTIVSCLPDNWNYLCGTAVNAVTDRFRPPCPMQNIPSAGIGRLIVEKRFAADYARAGFEPPYPSWPIRPGAFEDATGYTARALLKRIDEHVSMCRRHGEVRELNELSARPGPGEPGPGEPAGGRPERGGRAGEDTAGVVMTEDTATAEDGATAEDERRLDALDGRFRQLWEGADVSAALDPGAEDTVVPDLLHAGLEAWVRERGSADDLVFAQERLSGRNPALHADLRMIIDDRTERQRRWAFRAIASENARAVLNRLRNAVAAAGLNSDTGHRELFILRGTPWPTGPTTEQERTAFTAVGGVTLPPTIGDLQTFAALRTMLAERDPSLNAWLVARQPAHRTGLLSRALGGLASPGPARSQRSLPEEPRSRAPQAGPEAAEVDSAEPESEAGPERPRSSDSHPGLGGGSVRSGSPDAPDTGAGSRRGLEGSGSFRIGTTMARNVPVRLDLAALRTHGVLFAGTGSGKTVLLRRIVEECALQGVSSIVLDLNNDLARLGDAWPQAPAPGDWADDDADRAADYLENTDVVVWTPRRQGGRSLTFRPLPAFADVRDDPDEFDGAVEAALAALAPRVGADRETKKAKQEKAVLREALRYFGTHDGGSDFGSFVALLEELPEDASSLRRAQVIASDLAEQLQVATINDPLFAGAGEAADPGMLLRPPRGKRARVSVINLIGLPDPGQRQSFVNQLQMALFSWIKKYPAVGRPLGGLFVMDEARDLAPSGKMTACTESTLRLVSQARKYGLGLLFATQAPKDLHNRIPGNAATHFYGRLDSPVQIDAARYVARARGGDVPDISRLGKGQFYIATEGRGFQKIATPMCLSYHAGPLAEEEVIARAGR